MKQPAAPTVPDHLRVSVVIPTYNRATLVGRAIDSVLRAVDPGDEIIVVDDGSTDDTPRAVAAYLDRVRYVRIPNSGPGVARNHGLQMATRPLVAFLDSDDEWLADKLQLQRAVMAAHPELVFAFSSFVVHDDRSGRDYSDAIAGMWPGERRPLSELLGEGERFSALAPLPAGRPDFLVHVGDMYGPLLEQMYVSAITAIVRAERAGAAFKFAEDLRICEDWYCFASIARCGPAAWLDCSTVVNHGHTGHRLTFEQGQYGLLSARIAILERLWGQDDAFLSTNVERYRAVLGEQYARRARWLISRGRMIEARSDLRRSGESPRSVRLLSMLPGQLTHGLGAARRTLLRFRPT